MSDLKLISTKEVSKHCTLGHCWLVVENNVWDFSEFASIHPGGEAGHDATKSYLDVHNTGLVEKTLSPSKLIGRLDINTVDVEWNDRLNPDSLLPSSNTKTTPRPPLSSIINTHDFEQVAKDTFSKKAWAFYSSAATDLVSLEANKSFWNRVWFRPRLLRNVKNVDTRCEMQGMGSSLPIMVAPAAMAKLAYEEGEKGIAKAVAKNGIIQCIATTASYPVEDIVASVPANTNFIFQLYVHKDRGLTETLLQRVWAAGIRTIMVTIDSPSAGKREADERIKTEQAISMPMTGTVSRNDKIGGGLTRTTGGFIDNSLDWSDLAWFKRIWKGRLMIKGIQCVEDAKLAAQYGVHGIVLSNHGGRNLDTSPPALLTLLELRHYNSNIFTQTEVYIDGGITRGTDILKALCLGASGVLIGRPFLYALSYGEEGVSHLIDLLQAELESAMRLVGITHTSQAHPGLVNTRDLDYLVSTPFPGSRLLSKL
ncbi:Aldolase-type TIM barrel [Penicillium lagena]|uniref:Aldolase-type TIM barrel n=1 Tax=Penicillium lagena TaxID=94218 RepID=UPI00254118B8|nr:Aldolase-type TIM barrel [Penicillium lagena]KAJ5624256.1 Aldolase-type TIM barrel [Penicillium lagena]